MQDARAHFMNIRGVEIVDYIIIAYESEKFYNARKTVQEEVNKKMKDGYEPLGGVSVTVSQAGFSYFYTISQAMIKK